MCLGVPGKIVKIYSTNHLRMGTIDFEGVKREACLEYVPDANIDEYVLVHVGFALNVISEKEAQETLDLLRQIADIEQELNPDNSENLSANQV